jgi:glutamate formiminotransferase/formiminotetrahydrofolate cyclodeaminase
MNMQSLIECIPNFSEGRDLTVINAIARSIEQIEGVKLLDVDPGADTNRTVVTFVGMPSAVLEAAFQAIKTASELIDMRNHSGAHARMGATDVCPFVPISGITLEECVVLAKQLGERVGNELAIPIYLYEYAAAIPGRKNLADIRQGEYEGLPEKLKNPEWQPDFGPAEFNARSGASVIGVREFLIAYNVNLNTRDRKLAHQIALNIREKGRRKRDENDKIIRDSSGKMVYQPGTLKATRAVGWYIDEYQQAQISINLVNYKITPPHIAFDECCRQAEKLGLRVTGSELVGLIPLEAMLEAGRYFLRKQGRSAGVPDSELIRMAIQSMGLDDLSEFDPRKKIIEYQIAEPFGDLAQMRLVDFANQTSVDSATPGGGSAAAVTGVLGAALASMVANLTIGKKGYEDADEKLKPLAEDAQKFKNELLKSVDRDTGAFNEVMCAFSLPRKTAEQKTHRKQVIEDATKAAAYVPLAVMQLALNQLEQLRTIAEIGNQNALSDAGVAALMLRTCAEGAFLNVKVNLSGIDDQNFVNNTMPEAERILSLAKIEERKVLHIVEARMKEK